MPSPTSKPSRRKQQSSKLVRRMWRHSYGTLSNLSAKKTYPGMWRVAVVSIDQNALIALRKEIRQCINWYFDGESDYQTCLEESTSAIIRLLAGERGRGKVTIL